MFWRGVIGYLPVNIMQGLAGFLGIIVFTRLLPPADYGAYALAFSVMSLAHMLSFTWLEAAMARFYTERSVAEGLPDHFTTLYRMFAWLALALPAPVALILWAWPMSGALKAAIATGLASILVRSLVKLAQERRRAAGDVSGAAVLDIVWTSGGFLLGAGLALLGFGGAAPLAGPGIAAAICLIFALPVELRNLQGGRFRPALAGRYFAYGAPVSLSLILALAIATTDRFVIAADLGQSSVGVYQAGYSLSSRTLDVMFIWLGMAGAPAAIAALERGGKAALDAVAGEQSALMVAVTLPAAVGLALVAQPLCAVMIGPALRDGAAHVTPWIAASAFFAGVTTYYLLTAFTLGRRTPLLLLSMAIPASANLVLTLVLIPRFGLQGAMWATLASYALGAVAAYALGRRAIPLPLPWATIGKVAVASLVMGGAVLLTPQLGGGVVELGAKAGVGVLVYGIGALAFDIAGARSRGLRLARALQLRLA
ncbi:MAG TPA: lipopolysaccharide biosynthesis protein [Caulobacteraceae bacterium]|nr:lipopolysaccharide biosynthesis protein [Caulobacteraceae bacterium]